MNHEKPCDCAVCPTGALAYAYPSAEHTGRRVQAMLNAYFDAGGSDPVLLFHGTSDPLVPYAWAVDTQQTALAAGDLAILTTWEGAGHVPYLAHRQEILDPTSELHRFRPDVTVLLTHARDLALPPQGGAARAHEFVAEPVRALGPAPLIGLALPMGSWRLSIHAPGCAPVPAGSAHAPVAGNQRSWSRKT